MNGYLTIRRRARAAWLSAPAALAAALIGAPAKTGEAAENV